MDADVSALPGEAPPRDFRRNAVAFAADSATFMLGMNFISATTVLPSLIAKLSDSALMVGLASGLASAAWLLPQLVVASAVAHLPRKKPLIVRVAWLSRPLFLLVGLALWLFGASRPGVALAAVLVGLVVFFVCDAVVAVPWFDLLAKAIPPTRRGRVLGAGQVLGGLGGIGAGLAVRFVLSEDSPWLFPADYALLFAISSCCLLLSTTALMAIREPTSALPQREVPSVRRVLASLPRLLAADGAFCRLIVLRILASFVAVASAFYILHATQVAGLGLEVTGLFVSAQVSGTLVAGLLMGFMQDRFGPLQHMRVMIAVSALPAVLALLVRPLLVPLGAHIIYVYLACFLLLGVFMGSMGWPYFNWILEHVDDETQRPLYIGLSNTLGAAVMLAPTFGGWVVGTFSYEAAFGLALAFALGALALSIRLPDTRRAAAAGAGAIRAERGEAT